MKVKQVSQLDALKSVRRLMPPALKTRAERPLKGGGYRRPKNNKDIED